MKVFWTYLKKVWGLLVLSVSCIAIESVADLLQPTLLANIVDVGVANNDLPYILRTAALMLAIVGVTAFAAAGRNIFSSKGSERAGFLMRRDMYRKIQELSPRRARPFRPRYAHDPHDERHHTAAKPVARHDARLYQGADTVHRRHYHVKTLRLNPTLGFIPLILVPIIFGVIFLNLKIGFPLYARCRTRSTG